MANPKSKISWAHAFRDIGVAAVNRGQLLTFGILIIIGIVAWRLPPEELSKDVSTIISYLKEGYFVGYVLFGISLVAWIVHGRSLIRASYEEQARIAHERNEAQRRLGVRTGTTK